MNNAYYEIQKTPGNLGISYSYRTVPGGYHPLHWHDDLEFLYPLNGKTDVMIESQKYELPIKHLMVIESCQIHSTYNHSSPSMFLCVHLSKAYMQNYIPDIELYEIHCSPEDITDENFPYYLEICKMLEAMTRLYIEDATAFQLEADGIVLQILAHLIRYFSTNAVPRLSTGSSLARDRIRQVITYVEAHFGEPVSLTDVAAELGLGKEYFCRFFKQNMGISFLKYLNEIRLTHAYRDLINTDEPIAEIMEQNGLTNQKLFNSSFKELYGCTPSALRRQKKQAKAEAQPPKRKEI